MSLLGQNIPFLSVLAALAAACLSFLLPDIAARRLHLCVVLLTGGANGYLLFRVLLTGRAFCYPLGLPGAPWSSEFYAAPVEILLVVLFCFLILCAVLGGARDLQDEISSSKRSLYFCMMDLLLAGVIGLSYTNDLFSGYLFLEIITAASCALVMARETPLSTVATLRYLVLSLLGSGLFLFAASLLYAITGQLSMPYLGEGIAVIAQSGAYRPALLILSCLLVASLAMKSALFPFYAWMPGASANATTTSSAVLSGVILNVHILFLIKILRRVFSFSLVQSLGLFDILFLFGLMAMFAGSADAMRENHSKRMAAYSTVAQVGYIYLGIGTGLSSGMVAAMMQLIIHATAKTLLLVSIGGLIDKSGHRKQLYALKGAAYRNRVSGIGFTLGAFSMVGLPLLGGFISKLFLADVFFLGGWRLSGAVIALGISSVLNALYYIPAVIRIWTADLDQNGVPIRVASRCDNRRAVSVAALGLATCLLGVCYEPIANILSVGITLL